MVAVRSRSQKPPTAPIRQLRCAIYARKSNTEGLDGDFSSLESQRDACVHYIESQAGQGWMLLPDRYEDGGFSGGTMDRPGLQHLLADIEAGQVDCIVLYRLDRLSRSLIDFARIVDLLEAHGASFVSVTESFSTATSTGRLHLHMILAFAQYERELAAERIRDKVAGAKRRGKHCGGVPILGYRTENKKLVVIEDEAKLVRRIFDRFIALGSAMKVAAELNAAGHRTKSWPTATGKAYGGHDWNKSHIYRLLSNPLYVGLVQHRDQTYPGAHPAIITRETWNQARAILAEHHRVRANRSRSRTEALLRGMIRCTHCNCAMGPTFTKKNGRTYRFYLCTRAGKHGYDKCPVRSVAAGAIEKAVMTQLRIVFRTPELVARTFREAATLQAEEVERLRAAKRKLEADGGDELRLAQIAADLHALEAHAVTEQEIIDALGKLDPIWDNLLAPERNRIVSLLVSRVDVRPDSLDLRLRAEGLRSLVAELTASNGNGTTEATT